MRSGCLIGWLGVGLFRHHILLFPSNLLNISDLASGLFCGTVTIIKTDKHKNALSQSQPSVRRQKVTGNRCTVIDER
jgi:hypothetical protein